MSTISEKNLNKIAHLSFSKLSLFTKSLAGFRNKYINEKEDVSQDSDALLLGSLIDIILFTPDKFDETFIIGKPPKVAGKMGVFIETFAFLKVTQREVLGPQMSFIATTDDDLMKEAYRKADYKISYESVLEEFKTTANTAYYDYCIKVCEKQSTKKYVSAEMVEKARNIVKALYTNDFTKNWCKRKGKPQLKILWQNELFFCPVLSILDMLSIDIENKIIYVDDLKSTEKPLINFYESIEEYRYDIQAALYRKAVQYLVDLRALDGTTDFSDYKIVNRIVGVETYAPYKSLIVEFTNESIYRAELEITKIVSDLKWHLENDVWDFPRYIYEKNGVIKY